MKVCRVDFLMDLFFCILMMFTAVYFTDTFYRIEKNNMLTQKQLKIFQVFTKQPFAKLKRKQIKQQAK